MKIWTSMKIQIARTIPKLSSLLMPYTDEQIAPSHYAATEYDKLRAPVAQLIEHQVVTWEAVSSTPAGPTLRVLK